MTAAQKHALRISEIRQRLNQIGGLEGDAYDEAAQNEQRALLAELDTTETRYQAAVRVEGAEQATAAGAFGNGDGEGAEVRALLGRVRVADYLGAAAAGIGAGGAAAELNAALEVPIVGGAGGVSIPWEVLLTPEARQAQRQAEQRAFTDTGDYGGGIMQRPILQRLFGMDIMGALGVRIDSVPAGRTEWPLITGGVAPDQKAEGTAADAAVAAAFSTETLKPKRLTGKYEYTHEMAAQVPDLDSALRRDLADAVWAKMNALTLLGDEATNAQEPNGFLTAITAPTAPTAEAKFEDYAGSHALAIDGIHAASEDQVYSVIGVAAMQHAASVYQTGSGESGSEALKRRSMACMASSFVPVPTGANKLQDGNIFHAAGPNGGGAMRGDSVAAVWSSGLEVIRDIYSQASTGIVLTWISLWDLEAAFRSAAYKRVAFRLAYFA